mmetsp:Transcript_28884/g.77805  ORF Transcript_28884/g.77805 Transcript_28884/m.77805 type:complete len:776 (-) Transcript_28884:785-3112(-)
MKKGGVLPLLLLFPVLAGIGVLTTLWSHTDKETLTYLGLDQQAFHAPSAVATAGLTAATFSPAAKPVLKVAPNLDPAVLAQHCPLAKGTWCGGYWQQQPVPAKPPPQGSKACSNPSCNGVGWCNYDTGTCTCRAGYTGDDCSLPKKRECYNMGPHKRDKNMTSGIWLHTRCAGVCDDDVGECFCPSETTYGLKPENGAAARLKARPMNNVHPKTTKEGLVVPWSWKTHSYDDVFGPDGWCNAANPKRHLDCLLDGLAGPTCSIHTEQVCMNQCSGHGECRQGFCMCDPGWYGHDCAQRKKGAHASPGDVLKARPWLKHVLQPVPAALPPSERPFRNRPFIYVYDLPPEFNAHMMQYRVDKHLCTSRVFEASNVSRFVNYAYSLETHFHELMLTSEHRTLDPNEADYFYVPVHVSCLADVIGKADKPIFPDDVPGVGMWHFRVYHMSMMMREAWKWISTNLPYWDRKKGTDHIWLMTHDEGACYAPVEIWNSVLITHWGRLDMPHGSNSSYPADDYSRERQHPSLPHGWLADSSQAHPCHDPNRHLVVPVFKPPEHYRQSIYLGGPQLPRDIFLFFRGDIGLNRPGCKYSRCTRQKLWDVLYKKKDMWLREKHVNIVFGGGQEAPGDYSNLLSRSKFCLVLTGDGWSARYEDSTSHGCIPVIIMDNTLGPFESQIDYSKFAIRIGEHHLGSIVDTLLAIPPEAVAGMQANLADAWMRFKWSSHQLVQDHVSKIMESNQIQRRADLTGPGIKWAPTGENDAFSTVMQWLFHKLEAQV